MYQPTTRVLTVLELLQLHRRMKGAELAQRVEVIPGFKLPPMMFTNDEALALTIGLLATQHLGLTEIAHAVESTRAKLERVMPAELKERVQALTETVLLNLDTSPAVLSTEILIKLSSATKLQRCVHMHYRSYHNEETERDLDPYGLAHHRGKWYVVGYCSLRNDLRSFRLDRIFDVKLTNTSFRRPLHFDALAFLVENIASLPRQFTFELLLKTDLIKAQCEIMDALGVLESYGEGVLLRGSTDDLDWLARELAKLPFDFTVRKPEQLRDALHKRAIKLANLAEAF